jgi:hypothetical protein
MSLGMALPAIISVFSKISTIITSKFIPALEISTVGMTKSAIATELDTLGKKENVL